MRRVTVLFIVLVVLGVGAVQGQTGKPDLAQNILNSSLKKAESSQKNVWLIFHASWCGWCKLLDKMLDDPEIKSVIEKSYIVTHLDIMESQPGKKDSLENPGGIEIVTKLGGEKSGLPYFAFLDAKGKKLADSNVMPKNQNIGYPASKEEIAAFESLLKKTAPHMSDKERTRVVTYLEKNAPKH
jgi:thioredoxin-related protein